MKRISITLDDDEYSQLLEIQRSYHDDLGLDLSLNSVTCKVLRSGFSAMSDFYSTFSMNVKNVLEV